MRRDGEHTERRAALRLQGPSPVRVSGSDEGGRFDEAAVADNVAPGGLYVRLKRRPAIGAQLDGELTLPSGATIAATGHVLRLEALEDGTWGVAMRFTTAALLPAAPEPGGQPPAA